MANHPSAIKRAKQGESRRLRNRAYKTGLKTAVKQFDAALAANDAEKQMSSFRSAVSVIQETASKGVIHRRKAARRVSRLARRLNKQTRS